MERCLLDTRSLFTAMLAEIPAEERTDDPYGEELRTVFAVVLHAAADCLRAFGSLVVAEAEQREDETDKALAQDNSTRLLRGSILAGLEQLLGD